MDLASLEQRARTELAVCADEATLRAWHGKYFGKDGEVAQALKRIGGIPPAEKKAYGQEANRIKEALLQASEDALAAFKERALERSLSADAYDVTLPGRTVQHGRLHLATRTL